MKLPNSVFRFRTAIEALAAVEVRAQALFAQAAELAQQGKQFTDQCCPDELFVLEPESPQHAPPLLLIGGMGPLAGLTGFGQACQRSGERRIVVLMQFCSGADRTTALASESDSERLAAAIARQVCAGASHTRGLTDVLLLCNTAHGLLPAIQAAIFGLDRQLVQRLRWTSLIESVGRELYQTGKQAALVLSTSGTRRSGVYTSALSAAGIAAAELDDALQALCTQVIYGGVKALDRPAAGLAGTRLLAELRARHPETDTVVMACTELPILISWMKDSSPLLTGMNVLDPVALALASLDESAATAQSIHEQFARVAVRYPRRPAVIIDHHATDYATLDQMANRLARELLRLSPDAPSSEPVALLLDTDALLFAAMLGVLKAGKMYIPLDPSHPPARLRTIFADSQAVLLLTSPRYQDLAVELGAAAWATIDSNRIAQEGTSECPVVAVSAATPAYVLYTSGSTGEPKGVLQTHGYVLHLVDAYAQTGHFGCTDRFSLLSSPGFAGAVREIFCALLSGAAILPLDPKSTGAAALGRWLQEREISVVFAVATLFRDLARAIADQDQLKRLRRLYIGSETVYAADATLFQEHFPDSCLLVVSLGGTEVSPIRQFTVNRKTIITGSTVPAGYPVAGHEVLLLDEQGRPVADGELGEIVVRSRYMSPGYWRRPELTAVAFLSDPTDDERRLFRTGDLGRMQPDGCLIHHGRKDFQIKIRGYRVELLEVEAALRATGLLREAVTIARSDVHGMPQLIAYIVSREPSALLSLSGLRSQLAATLPEYMIPAIFVVLPALPLNANGKVDRRALPEPPRLNTGQGGSPRTPDESRLAVIWEEVLGVAPLGIDDDFFALGGHSVLAMRVLGRIKDTFAVELPLRTLFGASTIARLAAELTTAPPVGARSGQPVAYEEGQV